MLKKKKIATPGCNIKICNIKIAPSTVSLIYADWVTSASKTLQVFNDL